MHILIVSSTFALRQHVLVNDSVKTLGRLLVCAVERLTVVMHVLLAACNLLHFCKVDSEPK